MYVSSEKNFFYTNAICDQFLKLLLWANAFKLISDRLHSTFQFTIIALVGMKSNYYLGSVSEKKLTHSHPSGRVEGQIRVWRLLIISRFWISQIEGISPGFPTSRPFKTFGTKLFLVPLQHRGAPRIWHLCGGFSSIILILRTLLYFTLLC